jgi:uncharacterized membrane protein
MDSQQYGQPPGGQSYPTPVARESVLRWGPSSLGIDPQIGAGLSYLPLVGLVFFFVEKTNRFIRFHATQSILLSLAFVVLGVVRWALFGLLDSISSLAVLFFEQGLACVFALVTLAFAGLWLWGLISGFSGKFTKLPLIGDLAESWSGGLGPPAL